MVDMLRVNQRKLTEQIKYVTNCYYVKFTEPLLCNVHTRYCNDISCFYRVLFNWNKVRPQENANYTIFINLNLCTYTQNTSSVEILVTIS